MKLDAAVVLAGLLVIGCSAPQQSERQGSTVDSTKVSAPEATVPDSSNKSVASDSVARPDTARAPVIGHDKAIQPRMTRDARGRPVPRDTL